MRPVNPVGRIADPDKTNEETNVFQRQADPDERR
jgi:hypothetical protein